MGGGMKFKFVLRNHFWVPESWKYHNKHDFSSKLDRFKGFAAATVYLLRLSAELSLTVQA